MTEGFRLMAVRLTNAENRFIDYAMETAGLDRAGATAALRVMTRGGRRAPVRLDIVGGTFEFSHGAFADPDVIRRAADMGRG